MSLITNSKRRCMESEINFPGKMKTVELSPTDVKAIRKLYEIDCEWFNKMLDIPGNARTRECPVHLIRHHRTPDGIAIQEIVNMYPAITMQQIGDVFGVTREAIRLQYTRANDKSWSQGKKGKTLWFRARY